MLSALLVSLALLTPPVSAAPAWPTLATAPTGAVRDGAKDVALVIAIEDYWEAPDVPGARENAAAWRAYLKDVRGVPVVKVLTDKGATRELMLDAARQVRGRLQPGGRVWLVYIGHGAPSAERTEGLLVGADAQQSASSLYARSLPQSELLRTLGADEGVSVVAVLDACFSGATSSGRLVEGLQPLLPNESPGTGAATILSAGRAEQFAGPLPGLGRPAFSWLVLGALRGWGDRDGDGVVRAREAVDYANDRLVELVNDREQEPQLTGADLPLGKGRETAPALDALVQTTRPPPPTPAPAAAPEATARGTSFGTVNLDVDAQLRDQTCADEARATLATERESALAKEVDRVHAEGRAAWKALAAQGEACAKLNDPAARKPCLAAIDAFVTSAQGASVELPATSGSVPTACGAKPAADAARRGSVDLGAEVAAAGELRARVVEGPAVAGPGGATTGKMGYPMVRIAPGTFTMGSPASEEGRSGDEAEHRVTLTKAFLMGTTEVTQGLWTKVMGSNPSEAAYEGVSLVGDTLPVQNVSWCDAVVFANKLSALEGLTPAYGNASNCAAVTWNRAANGYRLPTEAEWEYAARAGTKHVYAGTTDAASVCRYGNVADSRAKSKWSGWTTFPCDDGVVGLAPVGRYAANALGLYDMTGNVREWTWDWYGDTLAPATDPTGASSGSSRVLRGGSWGVGPHYARVAYRVSFDPGGRGYSLGFRLSRTGP